MNGKTIAERKAEYEESALKQLIDDSDDDHEICTRCYCCDIADFEETCWQCNGFSDDEGDDYCDHCDGEGTVFWRDCGGNCDEQGNHKAGSGASQFQSGKAASGEGPKAPADGQATS